MKNGVAYKKKDQIRKKLRIWSNLLKKSLLEILYSVPSSKGSSAVRATSSPLHTFPMLFCVNSFLTEFTTI